MCKYKASLVGNMLPVKLNIHDGVTINLSRNFAVSKNSWSKKRRVFAVFRHTLLYLKYHSSFESTRIRLFIFIEYAVKKMFNVIVGFLKYNSKHTLKTPIKNSVEAGV